MRTIHVVGSAWAVAALLTGQAITQEFSPFQPPPPGGDGPWNHRVLLADSRDGLTWSMRGESAAEQASVPELFAGPDGRPILMFVDASGRSESLGVLAQSTDGSWQRRATNLRGVDPNVVRLPDHSYRAYVKAGREGAMDAYISADGLNWTRLGEVFRDARYPRATDPDVFVTDDSWVMLLSVGPRLLRCVSADGRQFSTDGETLELGGSVSDTVKVSGGWRTFFHVNSSPGIGGGMRIRSAFTADGKTWKVEPGDRLIAPNNGPARLGVADPAPLQLADGSWLMAVKSFIEISRPDQTPRGGFSGFDPSSARRGGPPPASGLIRVTRIESKYASATAGKSGRFVTGQSADLVLAAKGFNNTGGPLLFNHPTGLATDGKGLLMTDRWNNRVLIWKSAPTRNTPPDLVLGQKNFDENNPGTGRENLNWPGNVAITPDGSRIAVTDTDNDRVLIWNSFPTRNGTPADIVLELAQFSSGAPVSDPARREPGVRGFGPEAGAQRPGPGPGRGPMRLGWPWGVWTDGKKFAVVATHGSAVLIWNTIPTRDNQPPDLVLRPRNAGTPRNITSDGTFFAVSDHNNGERNRPGTMVWRSFPMDANQPPDFTWPEWLKGTFTSDRKLVMAGMRTIYIWGQPPENDAVDAEVLLSPPSYRNGDGPDAVIAGGRLYVCNYNGNNVLAWNSPPTHDAQPPDFALGSDPPEHDTWAENFFISNPVLATDGKSLFVSSDFDRKMFVWRNLPDESAAKPDLVFTLPEGPWDNALHGQTLALAGRRTVYLWRKLPLEGELPDLTLSGRIGSVELRELTGVALDDQYFYLADRQAGAIYVWEGIPARDSEPKFTLAMQRPGRLSSDGEYLTAAPFEGHAINLWRIRELSAQTTPLRLGRPGQFNLPTDSLIAAGRLFAADCSNHRVQVWDRLEDALNGNPANAFIGAANEQDRKPEIGRNQLFMPGTLAFDGSRLWVGEFKFSTRILRFSPKD